MNGRQLYGMVLTVGGTVALVYQWGAPTGLGILAMLIGVGIVQRGSHAPAP